MKAAQSQDEGSVLLLILGYALIIFLVITVLASATTVHLARTRLVDLADAAALDAADNLDEPAYYASGSSLPGSSPPGSGSGGTPAGLDGVVPINDATVREAATDYLATAPISPSLGQVGLGEPTGAPDARTAEVTLVAVVRPPVVTYVLLPWAGGIRLTATSRARASAVL